MIDPNVEQPITLREAAKLPALRRNGRGPHLSAIYRWVNRGVRGKRLETIVIGGSRCTTLEAVGRWINALTNGDRQHVRDRTSTQRHYDHERADAALRRGGW
jgi:hypothetical protein